MSLCTIHDIFQLSKWTKSGLWSYIGLICVTCQQCNFHLLKMYLQLWSLCIIGIIPIVYIVFSSVQFICIRYTFIWAGMLGIPWPPIPFLLQRCPGEWWSWWCRWCGYHWFDLSWWHLHPEIQYNELVNRMTMTCTQSSFIDTFLSEWWSLQRLTFRSSTTVSAKPTTYMATATALAKAKMRPIEPPNSGPRLLEIR